MQNDVAELRRAVMAAMETGNAGRARTILTEVAEVHPEAAARIRTEVLEAYSYSL